MATTSSSLAQENVLVSFLNSTILLTTFLPVGQNSGSLMLRNISTFKTGENKSKRELFFLVSNV